MVADMRGLYAIIDPEQGHQWQPLTLAEAVLAGGCCALQLRAKRLTDAEYLSLAKPLQAACRARGVPFVVNDRLELAVTLAADGLHLGQADVAIELARSRFQGQIGVSTHSLAQVDDAFARGADLIGFGPVFATGSKAAHDPVVGIDGLRAACQRARGPVVAIGGIAVDTLAQVVAAGPACVAVIGALCRAADPRAVAHDMHRAIRVAASDV